MTRPICVELPLEDHVCSLDPSQCCDGRMDGLEAKKRVRDPLDEAVVQFQSVVEVVDLPDVDGMASSSEFQDHIHGFQASQMSPTLVDYKPVKYTKLNERPLEKPPGCRKISALR